MVSGHLWSTWGDELSTPPNPRCIGDPANPTVRQRVCRWQSGSPLNPVVRSATAAGRILPKVSTPAARLVIKPCLDLSLWSWPLSWAPGEQKSEKTPLVGVQIGQCWRGVFLSWISSLMPLEPEDKHFSYSNIWSKNVILFLSFFLLFLGVSLWLFAYRIVSCHWQLFVNLLPPLTQSSSVHSFQPLSLRRLWINWCMPSFAVGADEMRRDPSDRAHIA